MASREGDGVLTGEEFDLFFLFFGHEELEENELVQQEFSEAIEEVGMIISSGYEKIHLNKLPLFALQPVDSSGSTSGSWPRKAEVLQNSMN